MLGAGALRRPRGMVWGERRERGSGWGTSVKKKKKRLQASTAGGVVGSITLQAVWCDQKKKIFNFINKSSVLERLKKIFFTNCLCRMVIILGLAEPT